MKCTPDVEITLLRKFLDKEECSRVGAYNIGVVDEIASHRCAGVVTHLFSV